MTKPFRRVKLYRDDFLFYGDLVWEEPLFGETVLPLYDENDIPIGEYDFERGELSVFPDIAGNDVTLHIPLALDL